MTAVASRSVEWSRISPRGREIIAQIGLRLVAGFSYDEIAEALERERPELRHLPLPERVTKSWVSARWRELRQEAETIGVTIE